MDNGNPEANRYTDTVIPNVFVRHEYGCASGVTALTVPKQLRECN
jgi:hypothetical protein